MNASAQVCQPTQSGFTLLELLLSLALTAMLLTMLAVGVNLVVNDWERQGRGLEERLDLSLALLRVEHALAGAFAHSYRDEESTANTLYFVGAPREVRWVSTVSPGRMPGLTAWRLVNGEDGALQLHLAPAFADNPDERLESVEPVTLLSGYRMRLRYLALGVDDKQEWVDRWDGVEERRLPAAVHMRLERVDGEEEEDGRLGVLAFIAAQENPTIRPPRN